MSVSQSLFKSSSILFLGRLINRSVGLLSTLILARILTPDDFGIVAIASIVVFFFDAMSQVGTREYLTHKKKLIKQDINTAWTLNALTKLGMWLLFVIATPFIGDFYGLPELSSVLYVVSVVLILLGFESIGLILAQRELNYLPVFKLQLVEKIIGFAVMLALLSVIQNYWVMIIALVSSYIARFIGSYVLVPHKPSFSLQNISEQWSFSKWLLPKGAIGFLKSELDTVIVSKSFGLAPLGGFNIVKSLVSMVGRDVIQPATEPLLAAFSRGRGDREQQGFQVQMSLWVISIAIIPVVGYTYFFSGTVVLVLYGEQWLKYAPVLEALAPLIYIFATTGVLINFLTSQAKVKQLFYVELSAMILMASVLVSLSFKSLVDFAYVRTIVSIVFWIGLVFYVKSLSSFSFRRTMLLLLPLAVGLMISAQVVKHAVQLEESLAVVELLVTGTMFTSLYFMISLLLMYPIRNTNEVIYVIWFLKKSLKRE